MKRKGRSFNFGMQKGHWSMTDLIEAKGKERSV
jgi:hypothetical protein